VLPKGRLNTPAGFLAVVQLAHHLIALVLPSGNRWLDLVMVWYSDILTSEFAIFRRQRVESRRLGFLALGILST
jgi:hypothetical protein